MTPQEELCALMAKGRLVEKALADMIDVDRSTVYRWRTGQMRIPKVVLLWLRLHVGKLR